MNRDLKELKPRFLTLLKRALKACISEECILVPYNTKRDVWQQAKFYRQSRRWVEIRDSIDALKETGAPFLSKVLSDVGPQYGRWATNAPPGFSWHQWGEACDCFVLQDGKAIWDTDHCGYTRLKEECEKRGLTIFSRKDPNHCQLKKHSPSFYYRISTIDERMRKLYPEDE